MKRKGILIGALCLALSSIVSIASVAQAAQTFTVDFFSWPNFFGKYVADPDQPAALGLNDVQLTKVISGTATLNLPDVALNEPATFPKGMAISGKFDLNFPCSAASKACVSALGIQATYPIVSKNAGFESRVAFSTSPLTAPVFDQSKGRVIFTQNAAAASVIKVTVPTLKLFTIKFGKISVFYNTAGGVNLTKGIKANYTIVDATGATVDQGQAVFLPE